MSGVNYHAQTHRPKAAGGTDPLLDQHIHPALFMHGMFKDDWTDGPVIDEVGNPYFPTYTSLYTTEAAWGVADNSYYEIFADEPFAGAGYDAVGVHFKVPGLYATELRFIVYTDETNWAWSAGWDLLSASYVGLGLTSLPIRHSQGYVSAAETGALITTWPTLPWYDASALAFPSGPTEGSRVLWHSELMNLEVASSEIPSMWVAPVPGGDFEVNVEIRAVYLGPNWFLDT